MLKASPNLRRPPRSGLACAAALVIGGVAPSISHAVEPVASWDRLTTGNGFGFGVWENGRLSAFYARPYKHPTEGRTTVNRIAAPGAAFGLRALGEERCLCDVPARGVGYLDESHVIFTTQRHGTLEATTYVLSPWATQAAEVALLLEVSNPSPRVEPHAAAWFQGRDGPRWELTDLQPGETRWVGVRLTEDGLATLDDPEALLTSELRAWEAWRGAPPRGLSPMELRVWRQSETVLRMAQVREPAPAGGAVLASLPPGIWWIAWVRDMAYALVALAATGHTEEALAGVEFWAGAESGRYEEDYVGVPYPVSVTRYFGDGGEESDADDNGPNIEFDGFGLALWAAHSAGSDAMDAAADTLLALRDEETGLIRADSSIWEVHWNGRQKRFAYTSIVAARGLCDAGRTDEARALRDSIVERLVDDDGYIAQSFEELTGGLGAVDGAVLEAINLGLIDPHGMLADATVDTIFEVLRVDHGKGLARNDDGGGYDEQEWVFIGLRLAVALRKMRLDQAADAVLDRYTLYASLNHGLLPELLHPSAATYRGATPMVGFGAGAWQLAILAREHADEAEPAHVVECFGGGP